ncbi:NUDIX hydrolase [Candidatus Roizmanbacteria bacterium]|nr:NUDIX hydrolase [Candidatus Roizmanbacteria bacterium]
MELNETIIDTVRREFEEELSYQLTKEPIEIFDISIIAITRNSTCKMHYDFWSLVFMDKKENFIFDTGEFYDAGWFSFEDAFKIMRTPEYLPFLKKLQDRY